MKADNVDINQMYWSTRHKANCIVAAKAEYLVYIVFREKEKSGWVHCAELEEIEFQDK